MEHKRELEQLIEQYNRMHANMVDCLYNAQHNMDNYEELHIDCYLHFADDWQHAAIVWADMAAGIVNRISDILSD